jgi:hypothetical protein
MTVFYRKSFSKHHILRPDTDHAWCCTKLKIIAGDEVPMPDDIWELCNNCRRQHKTFLKLKDRAVLGRKGKHAAKQRERYHSGRTLPKPGMNTP